MGKEAGISPNELNPSSEIQVVHDIPLGQLLPDSEIKQSRFVRTPVSLYKYTGLHGPEHMVRLPATSGYEWYEHFRAIAPYDPKFEDVVNDTRFIARNPTSTTAIKHHGAGSLWDTIVASLPAQLAAFDDDSKLRYFESRTVYAQRQLETQATRIVNTALLAPPDAARLHAQRLTGYINGQETVDNQELMSLFGLNRAQVGTAMLDMFPGIKNRRRTHLPPREIGSKFFPRASFADACQIVVRAARTKYQNESDFGLSFQELAQRAGDARYAVMQFTGSFTSVQLGDYQYILPFLQLDLPPAESVEDEADVHKIEVKESGGVAGSVFVKAGGLKLEQVRTDFTERLEAKAAELRENRRKIVPIVRVLSERSGNQFVVHEEEPELPERLIQQLTEDVKVKEPQFEPSWMSGVTGSELMVLAHPGVRNIKDGWGKIWTDQRITISQLMGEQRKLLKTKDGTEYLEPDQFNGPVQIAVVAFQAMRRHPSHFAPFFEKVRQQFAQG